MLLKRKRWGILLVALVMAFVTACSGGGVQEANDAPQSSGESQTTPGESGVVAETSEPVELTVFINHTWFPTDVFEGAVAEEITKKTGVTLKIIRAADANQLPVMIASGDLPDLVYTSRNLDRMSDPNISYAWNELTAQYAPDFQPSEIEIRNAKSLSADDNYYTILNAFATPEEWSENTYGLPSPGTRGLAVRQDLLEELGNPPLNTLDDYKNVLGMVKERYPDVVPLVMDRAWMFKYFLGQFGIDSGNGSGIYERDGQIHYQITHPNYLDYYKYINSLYRSGFFMAENLAYQGQEDLQYVHNGKAFSHSWVSRGADEFNEYFAAQGDEKSRYTQLQNISDQAVFVNDGIGWSGVFITKNNKNPEASIRFMQFMFSEEGQRLSVWGREGVDYTLSAEGYPVFTPEYIAARNDPAAFNKTIGANLWNFGMSAVTEGYLQVDPTRQQTVDAQLAAKSITIYRPELSLILPPADTEERNILNKLNEMVRNEETKVILANSEEAAEAAYNNMIRIAEEIGMLQLEEYLTQRYQELMN